MSGFKNKTIWITGASSGIGKALAIKFSSLGANIVLSSRNEDELLKVANQCSTETLIIPLDLAKQDNFTEATKKVCEKFKTIDYLINNGGISQRSKATETNLEVDRLLMEINYFGTIALTKAVLPIMQNQQRGHIITISSLSGKFGFFSKVSICGSKICTSRIF